MEFRIYRDNILWPGKNCFMLLLFALTCITGHAAIYKDSIPRDPAFQYATGGSISTDAGSGGMISLNLKLLDFMATTVDAHTNRIQWDVTGAEPATIYQVERSLDGKQFSVIASISAIDGQNTYYYIDDSVSASANWYRMVAVEKERVSSSIIVLVRYASTNYGLSLRPSATNAGSTTIFIGSSRNTTETLAVIDVSGRMLLRKSFAVSTGGNYIPLSLSGFTSGFYYFSITDDYGKQTVLPFQKL